MQTLSNPPATFKAGDHEALERGTRFGPNGNDAPCVSQFIARGIPADQIETFGPGQNVRTYKAWRALGRQVRKGERSVKLTVWCPIVSKEPIRPGSKECKVRSRPVTACVFHVSQTDEIGGGA